MSNQEILEKAIVGFERYIVRSDGTIINSETGHIKKYTKDRKGYWRVSLYNHNKTYSRLVSRTIAMAFIPNPDNKPMVNHINGRRDDDRIENLEWVTASENVQDGFNRGRIVWNKGIRSIDTMNLEDLAKQLPRLQREALALWGEDLHHEHYEAATAVLVEPEWMWHLRCMVVADDPIKYLGENI